jgi:hypothetical protein
MHTVETIWLALLTLITSLLIHEEVEIHPALLLEQGNSAEEVGGCRG